MTTHFQLFALNEDADEQQIKTRYKQLAMRCHPDKGGSAALMVMIQNSYHKLILGEGALQLSLAVNQQDKQLIQSLKKTIHQQQFAIQKLSIAIAKRQQEKENKALKRVTMPLLVALLILMNVALAWAWYTSQAADVPQTPPSLADISPSKQAMPPLAQTDNALDNSYKLWELKQKLRLSSARQQYLQTDFEQSKQLISQLLTADQLGRLTQEQRQFLTQHQIQSMASLYEGTINMDNVLLEDLFIVEDPFMDIDMQIDINH
ncbi:MULTISPECIES: J domain-containing protein [unclassified Agarivorans]|uniref:J domain-containing protein n=1 Tax=unclassified Agarivorans TaxID=2636026 RepID=UPI003D7C66DF